MSDREEEPRSARSGAKGRTGASPARWLYGALLVAIGGCLGIVIGSVSETPRILLERLRGPVQTVDLDPPAPASAAAPATAPLDAFSELQGAPAAKARTVEVAKAEPAKAEPVKTPAKADPKPEPRSAPPAPAVSSAPPAAPASAAATTATVVQVLSLADKKQADAMIAKLKAQGFESYTTPMPDKSGRLRVRVRPKSGETTAALEARLRELGFKTWTTAE